MENQKNQEIQKMRVTLEGYGKRKDGSVRLLANRPIKIIEVEILNQNPLLKDQK